MHSSAAFLQTLALVLGVAAMTMVIFHRLKHNRFTATRAR